MSDYQMWHPSAVIVGQDAYQTAPSWFQYPAARYDPSAGLGQGSLSAPVAAQTAAPAAVIQENPSMYEQAMRDSRSTAIENSYLSQMFAREQMDFQAASQLASMEFNSAEAAKNRNWQEYMSNTAHQREVRDLLAAGLNPILSAMGGNGATTGSGATASSSSMSGSSGSVDTSGNQAVASLVGAALQAENNYEMNKVNAITNLAIADQQRKNNLDMQDKTLEMQRKQLENALEIARMSSESNKYSADMSKTVAELYTASQLATAGISAGAMLGVAGINANSAQSINAANIANERYMAEMYPNSVPQYISRIVSGTSGMTVGEASNYIWHAIRDFFDVGERNKNVSSISGSFGGSGRKMN